MKVKYELDQRKTSGIQFNIEGKKRSFTPKLGDKKIVRTIEEHDSLDRAIKSGYLVKHLGSGNILTKDGEMKYATYKKQVKALKGKLVSKNAVVVPNAVKKVDPKIAEEAKAKVAKEEADKKAKEEADKEKAEKEAKAVAAEEAKAKAEKEAEMKAEKEAQEAMEVKNVEAAKAAEAKAKAEADAKKDEDKKPAHSNKKKKK